MFIDQTWEVIKSDKELNLPDQKEMVANYRCNEIKEEALEKVKDYISKLKHMSAQIYLDDFGDKCQEIVTASITYYDENAHYYQKTVFEKVRASVVDKIFDQLFQCFDSQMKMNRSQVQQRFTEQLKKNNRRKDVVNDKFQKQAKKLLDDSLKTFVKNSADLIIENSGWGDQVMLHQNELLGNLNK